LHKNVSRLRFFYFELDLLGLIKEVLAISIIDKRVHVENLEVFKLKKLLYVFLRFTVTRHRFVLTWCQVYFQIAIRKFVGTIIFSIICQTLQCFVTFYFCELLGYAGILAAILKRNIDSFFTNLARC
jgi:hypothetical protein